jgi:hypothetical protein
MSENVTHVAVCDDVSRLASVHEAIPAEFKQALEQHHDIARLGSATRSADRWSAEVIARSRDHWPAPGAAGSGQAAKKDDEVGVESTVSRKLAFVLGALTHRAADRLFKPIFQYCREQYGEEAGLDCSIHCDVLVFTEVYGGGHGGTERQVGGSALPTAMTNPYQAAVFRSPTGEAGQQAEEVFRVLWQRALISMHTFAPDASDMDGWLDRLFRTLPRFSIDLAHYQQVVERPDPAKFKRYLEDTNAYNRSDPLIVTARRVQRGEAVSAGEVEASLDATDERSSRYARALQKGMGYLLAGGRLWQGEIDVAQAKAKFDVGVAERSLVFTG